MSGRQITSSTVKTMPDINDTLARSLAEAARGEHDLTSVRSKIVGVLRDVNSTYHASRLGFVAGVISSDGLGLRDQNLSKLQEYTRILRRENTFPIFSAGDFYDRAFFQRFDRIEDAKTWDDFWRHIFVNGKITDLFMTPKWDKSEGSRYEFGLAKEMRITVHMVDKKTELLLVCNGG